MRERHEREGERRERDINTDRERRERDIDTNRERERD